MPACTPVASQEQVSQTVATNPQDLIAELRDARDGVREISDERLLEIELQVGDWEYQPPANYDGPSWLELRQDLRSVFLARGAANNATLRTSAAGNDYFLGDLLERSGQRTAALELLAFAIEEHTESNPYLPLLFSSLADLRRDEGEVSAAKYLLEQAEQICLGAETSFSISLPTIQANLGQAYLEIGMVDVADPLIRAAYAAADTDAVASASLWGHTVVRMVNLAHALEAYEEQYETWEAFNRAVQEHARVAEEDPDFDAWRLRVPAQTHTAIAISVAFGQVEAELRGRGEAGRGAGMIREVLDLGAASKDQAFRAYTWLANSQLDREQAAAARESLAEARNALGELEGERTFPRMELAALEARQRLQGQADDGDWSAWLEEELIPTWEDLLADWSHLPIRGGGIGVLQYSRRKAVVGSLLSSLLKVEAKEAVSESLGRALHELFRIQSLGTQARSLGLGVPTLAEVQASLEGSEEGLVIWVPGREASHAFAVDATSVSHHSLAPSHRLESLSRILSSSLGSLQGLRADRQAARLERALSEAGPEFVPKDLEKRIAEWTGVITVGLESFGYVPFEALGTTPGEFGRRLRVTGWPSVPVGLWLRQGSEERGPLQRDMVVLAAPGQPSDPAQQRRYPALEFPLERLQGMAKRLSDDPNLVLDESVDPFEALGAGASVMHLLAHGVYEARLERPAGILLQPAKGLAGALFPEEVERLRLGPPLVVLTACGTDRSRPRRGDDGRASFSGAFLSAGSSAVLTSTTELELGASIQFLDLVYAALDRGEPLAEALRIARCEAQPAELGVPSIHSSLLHLRGDGRLSFVAR